MAQSTKWRWSVRRGVLVVLSLLCAGACTSDEDECTVHEDCRNSNISQEQGRCGPQVACVEGTCDAWCPIECEVSDPDVNPCAESGWVCAPFDISRSRCTPTEIECEGAADCPAHKPSSSSDGAWTCDEGICRFPGFSYLYPNE